MEKTWDDINHEFLIKYDREISAGEFKGRQQLEFLQFLKDNYQVQNSILYAFVYCPCTEESAWSTVSIHITRPGAEQAMRKHKEEEHLKFEQAFANEGHGQSIIFGAFEDWDIIEYFVCP